MSSQTKPSSNLNLHPPPASDSRLASCSKAAPPPARIPPWSVWARTSPPANPCSPARTPTNPSGPLQPTASSARTCRPSATTGSRTWDNPPRLARSCSSRLPWRPTKGRNGRPPARMPQMRSGVSLFTTTSLSCRHSGAWFLSKMQPRRNSKRRATKIRTLKASLLPIALRTRPSHAATSQ